MGVITGSGLLQQLSKLSIPCFCSLYPLLIALHTAEICLIPASFKGGQLNTTISNRLDLCKYVCMQV